MRPLPMALVALLTAVATPHAQEIGEIDVLLDRLGQYLVEYESALTRVVAEERYEQQTIGVDRPVVDSIGRPTTQVMPRRSRRRVLDSDIAFLRLPGDGEWFGVRDVRQVDGKPVNSGPRGRAVDDSRECLDRA